MLNSSFIYAISMYFFIFTYLLLLFIVKSQAKKKKYKTFVLRSSCGNKVRKAILLLLLLLYRKWLWCHQSPGELWIGSLVLTHTHGIGSIRHPFFTWTRLFTLLQNGFFSFPFFYFFFFFFFFVGCCGTLLWNARWDCSIIPV